MSMQMILLASFLVFCLGIGIGTCIKFFHEITPSLAARFLAVLPLQTVFLTIFVFFVVTPKVFKDVFDGEKRRWGFLGSLVDGVQLFFVSLGTCIMFMPIFAGKMAHIAINEKKRIKHAIKRAKNECYPLVVDDVLCRYA